MATGNKWWLHLRIPEAVFIGNVESFMRQLGKENADTKEAG
jgi:hypothetical protein